MNSRSRAALGTTAVVSRGSKAEAEVKNFDWDNALRLMVSLCSVALLGTIVTIAFIG